MQIDISAGIALLTIIGAAFIAYGVTKNRVGVYLPEKITDINKRIDGMETNCKENISKLETADDKMEISLAEIKRTHELCLTGCYARQKSLVEPMWRYLRDEKGIPNFVPAIVYEKNHADLQSEVRGLAKKLDDREDKMFEKMDKILTAVSK